MKRLVRTRLARRGEDGYAIVLTALLIVPLMLFAGLAVDVGSWYAEAQRIQRAADAASLAGVVWQPDFAQASTVAQSTAALNGYTDGVGGVHVDVIDAGTQRLQVNITVDDVGTFFGGLVLNDVLIERRSVAEYLKPLPMGSPENSLGNDPVAGGTQPNIWAVTFGNTTGKGSGDRYHTVSCAGANIGCAGVNNAEFREEGYIFTVDVDQVQSGQPLTFEAFDAVFHNYGDNCTENNADGRATNGNFLPVDVSTAAWYTGNQKGLGTYPQERYERGATIWCTGDNGGGDRTDLVTSYIVRGPDNTPFDSTDNPVVCYRNFGTIVPGQNGRPDLATLLLDDTLQAPQDLMFRQTFREWANVCTINNPALGEYFLQVRTNADTSSPPSSLANAITTTTQGRNRYSLRAGFGTRATNPQFGYGVSLHAQSRLPLFVNRPGAAGVTSDFYLARVLPGYAGSTLKLDFFDITDFSGAGNMVVKVIPPAEGLNGLTQFSNCEFNLEGSSPGPIADTNCEIQAASGSANGDAIIAEIELPADYNCNAGDPFGCWIKVQMTFGAATPQDTTTWTATLSGDPVRLVE